MKWTRKTSKAVIFGLPALIFIACSSGEDTGEDSTSGSNDDSSQEDTGKKDEKPKADKKPKDARGGVVGNWDILNKPKITEEYGTFGTFTLNVRNNSDDADQPFFEVRLTNKAGDLVTSFDCSGDEIEPDQKAKVECFSVDDYDKSWTDYEIKNAF